MPTFPQLSTGATAQYPLAVRRIVRTVVNEAADGRQFKYADASFARAEWDIRLAALTNAEWALLEELFASCEGRLRTFTFLDPLDNLLRHSEDFTRPEWEKDPLLTVTPGQPDPWGTQRATRLTNSGVLLQEMKQNLPAPGTYKYNWSLLARAESPMDLRVRLSAGPSYADQHVPLTPEWQAISVFADLDWAEDGVLASLALPPGTSADVAAAQCEAQLAPSSYKRTGSASGVYPLARFATDRLLQTTTDLDQHETVIRITAPWER